MSACLEAVSPAALNPSIEARAGRLANEYLTAAFRSPRSPRTLGVSEKRMHVIIREILGRRMPAAPEKFVAIQVSRLNAVPLVACSAMTGMNLKAVDRGGEDRGRDRSLSWLRRRPASSSRRVAPRGARAKFPRVRRGNVLSPGKPAAKD